MEKQRFVIPDDIRNIGNILTLPCVRSVTKWRKSFKVKVRLDVGVYVFALPKDSIVKHEDGTWNIEESEIEFTEQELREWMAFCEKNGLMHVRWTDSLNAFRAHKKEQNQ